MRIFASWSGEDSRAAAELFRDWLPNVLQEVEVWVSSQDISKGEKWSESLWASLSDHQFGILLVTKTNFSAPWILFEAGALSKSVKSLVIPILCNLGRTDIASSPLNQFQNATASREDIYQVVASINDACERRLTRERLRSTLDKWWPDFEQEFGKITFKEGGEAKPSGAKADSARLDKIEGSLEDIMGMLQRLRRENSRKIPLPPTLGGVLNFGLKETDLLGYDEALLAYKSGKLSKEQFDNHINHLEKLHSSVRVTLNDDARSKSSEI